MQLPRFASTRRFVVGRLAPASAGAYLIAIVATILVAGVRLWLAPMIGDDPPFSLFLLAVAVAAGAGGLGPGLVATGVGAVAGLLFVAPVMRFRTGNSEDQLRLAAFIGAGLLISWLYDRVHRTRQAADADREQLKVTLARKAGVLATALDAIITIDETGSVVEFNPAAERIFGYREADVIGREMAGLIVPPALRDAHRAGMARCLTDGSGPALNRRLELTGMRADGSEFPAELSITRIPSSGPPLFTGHLRDITERKQKEQALASNEEALRQANADLEARIAERTTALTEANGFLQALLENVQDGIVACDANGVLTLFNRATREFHGLPEARIPAERWVEHYHLFHADGVTPMATKDVPLYRALQGEHVQGVEMLIAPTNGTRRVVLASGRSLLDEHGARLGAVVSMHDITARKQADETVRRAQHELEERVEARTAELRRANQSLEVEVRERAQVEAVLREVDRRKNEFIATLAHELRNPLAPLRNAVEVLNFRNAEPATTAAALGIMERQLGQMVRLIDDLLDLSRITQGKLELRSQPMPIGDAIDSAIEAVRPLLEARGHTLSVSAPDDPVHLDGDLTRLAQVFLNLLNNSAKYTEPGGLIRLTVERADRAVTVTVVDNGIGIPPGQLDSVFEPFTQVDQSLERTQGGLGIGLTLVQRLVRLHGGRVEARSAGLGHGASFAVTLPVLAEDRPFITAVPADARGARLDRRLKVLVVDDNLDATEMLSVLVGAMGHDTRSAHDGLAAVAAAGDYRPDVALLDLGLPGLNGYETARRIRREPWGGTVVIAALSGWGQDEDKQQSSAAGFDAHFVKPLDPSALKAFLADVAARRDATG